MRVSVTEQLQDLGIQLRTWKIGQHHSTCPECSHTRRKKTAQCLSVKIEEDCGLYHCSHCGWEGSVFAREAREDGGRRPERSRRREEPPRRPDYQVRDEDLPPAMLRWWAKRGIMGETLRRNRVALVRRWFPQTQDERPAMAFPLMRAGEVINVKYRSNDDDGEKIFTQEKGAEKILIGLDDLDDPPGTVILVEGEPDKLSLNEIGFWNVLSVPDGAPEKPLKEDTAGDPDRDAKFAYLWNCRDVWEAAERIILAFDGDGAGRALEYEVARRVGRAKCWVVSWPQIDGVGPKDANEVLMEHGEDVLRECIELAEPLPISSLHETKAFLDQTWALYRGEIGRGVSTGWIELDQLVRIRGGDLIVVSGFPSSGKTNFLDALLVNLADSQGWRMAMASFEKQPYEHIADLAQKRLKLPFFEGPTDRMNEGELGRAMDWVGEHFVWLQAEDETQDFDWILETARAAVLRYGTRALVIDPYNQIDHARPKGMNETDYVSRILTQAQRFAKLTDSAVFFVAHPAKPEQARGATGEPPRPPTLYSISGGAHWYNKADVGIIVHRVWNEDGTRSNAAEIHVKKVRHRVVGTPGVRTLVYDVARGVYE